MRLCQLIDFGSLQIPTLPPGLQFIIFNRNSFATKSLTNKIKTKIRHARHPGIKLWSAGGRVTAPSADRAGFINPLRPSGNYMNHLLWQWVMLHFVFMDFVSVALQALTNLGRLSSRRWQSFPTVPYGTGLTCGQHIESHSCIFSFPNRTVTSLFK
jgi:hypothetical protein